MITSASAEGGTDPLFRVRRRFRGGGVLNGTAAAGDGCI